MPRPKRSAATVAAGAYSWLLGREELDYRNWIDSTHSGTYPRSHVLDQLRAGQAVTVRLIELPASLGGLGRPVNRNDTDYWRRQHESVTVTVDGGVVPAVDDSDLDAEYRDL